MPKHKKIIAYRKHEQIAQWYFALQQKLNPEQAHLNFDDKINCLKPLLKNGKLFIIIRWVLLCKAEIKYSGDSLFE